MKANIIVFEISAFIFSLAIYLSARKALGKSTNRTFFLGAVGLSLLFETAGVLLGYRNYFWYAQHNYFNHYPLGGIIIWLGLVPLAACLTFYILTACSYFISKALLPKGSIWSRGALAGLTAVVIAFMIEIVAVTNHWWTWNLKSYYFLDIPVFYLVFLFIMVFVFTSIFERTMVQQEDFRVLKWLENKLVRPRILKSQKKTKNLYFGQRRVLFYSRLVASVPVLAAAAGLLTYVFWLIANRGQIPPGW